MPEVELTQRIQCGSMSSFEGVSSNIGRLKVRIAHNTIAVGGSGSSQISHLLNA